VPEWKRRLNVNANICAGREVRPRANYIAELPMYTDIKSSGVHGEGRGRDFISRERYDTMMRAVATTKAFTFSYSLTATHARVQVGRTVDENEKSSA